MNQVISAIHARRSVRSFSPKPVPRETLQAIIAAGASAPSGMNSQPWRFVVVQDAAARALLVARTLPKYAQWLAGTSSEFQARRAEIDAASADPIYYGAPVIVFVIGAGMTADFDCSMACQNIMLAARSCDIGSCWVYMGQLGIADPDIRALLGLGEGEKVYGPIVMGYPAGPFPAAPERKPLAVQWV